MSPLPPSNSLVLGLMCELTYIYFFVFFWFWFRDSIRSLEDEGLIYSTIDEFHFKSAA